MSENDELLKIVTQRASSWLGEEYDHETRLEVKSLLDGPESELIDSFYRDLEFGTGGLRGIMGAGTNRMNIYTLSMATQGLANYLLKEFADRDSISVAIAYDCRNNNRLFAETTAAIFSANGINVFLFDDLRPTPQLSFTIRHLKCQAGVVITASHNPKEYNGYKVYWEDGGQIIAPHDVNIINEVQKTTSILQVKRDAIPENIKLIGQELDRAYLDTISRLSLSPGIIKKNSDISIVFTPIHGATVKLVPDALRKFGFTNIINVPEQDVVDGNFPTVMSPNPEEAAALRMAIDQAEKSGAELLMGTDPDGDRVGIAVRDQKGEFVLLNGNQTASLLLWYILNRWKELDKIEGGEYIVKTIVTSELLSEIAKKFDVECYDVLTGFKFIAALMRELEGQKRFIAGFEESYGYLFGDSVRDKDAVLSSALIAETAAWAREQGMTLYELLLNIYREFGYYRETLVSIVKKGKSGSDEIAAMMERFRSSPPDSLAGSSVMLINDYLKQKSFDSISQRRHTIELPKSNVLQFFSRDGSVVSIRPSGTEPKIKFYIGVRADLESIDDFEKITGQLKVKASRILKDIGIE